jgi:dissimilatory sulfite reductase (desulfoviridin) alpha/beta subunit
MEKTKAAAREAVEAARRAADQAVKETEQAGHEVAESSKAMLDEARQEALAKGEEYKQSAAAMKEKAVLTGKNAVHDAAVATEQAAKELKEKTESAHQ